MKKDAIDLTYALTLPPEKAVAYFRRKGRRVSFDWHSMWKEAHATAFTVANCAKLDVLRDLQLGIRTMLKEGKSEQWFVRTLEPVLRAKGWWGPRDEVNPRTGVWASSPARTCKTPSMPDAGRSSGTTGKTSRFCVMSP